MFPVTQLVNGRVRPEFLLAYLQSLYNEQLHQMLLNVNFMNIVLIYIVGIIFLLHICLFFVFCFGSRAICSLTKF